VLKGLLGEDYRGMSRRLAECPLFGWFCGMEELAAAVGKPPIAVSLRPKNLSANSSSPHVIILG
jgi:hypothetical protein